MATPVGAAAGGAHDEAARCRRWWTWEHATTVGAGGHQAKPRMPRLTKNPEPSPRNPNSWSRSVQTVARASRTSPRTHSTKDERHQQLRSSAAMRQAMAPPGEANERLLGSVAAADGVPRSLGDQLGRAAEAVEGVAHPDLGGSSAQRGLEVLGRCRRRARGPGRGAADGSPRAAARGSPRPSGGRWRSSWVLPRGVRPQDRLDRGVLKSAHAERKSSRARWPGRVSA